MQRAIWILLGLGLVVRTAIRDRGVIIDHIEFGRRLFAGADLYAPYLDPKPLHPVYPPSFGLLTGPFALLPDTLARAGWGVLQVLALAWIGTYLARWLQRELPELEHRVHAILALSAVLASRYILRDTHGGGGNLINCALVLLAIHRADQGRPLSSALALGFSLATKPTAVLFVPLLMLFGHVRAALGALGVAATLLTGTLLLNGHGLDPLATWWHGTQAYGAMVDLFETPAGGFPPFSWMNQCVRCAIARYLGTVPEAFTGLVPGYVPGLGLSATATTRIRHATTAVVLALTFSAAFRDRSLSHRRVPTIGALFAASLLLSPISWKAHHVALIPAMFLLAIAMVRGVRAAWVLAVAYALACVLGEEIVGKSFKNIQQSCYFVTAGTFVLWGLCLSPHAFSFSKKEPVS